MGESIDLQSRVAADLTSRAPSLLMTGWTAEKPFAPTWELGELETLHVAVCPATRSSDATSRQLRSRELGVWIGIIKRLTTGADAAADLIETAALIDFAEQIHDLFVPPNGTIYRLNNYRATTVEAVPLYDPEKLRSNREFRSAMLVTFKIDT